MATGTKIIPPLPTPVRVYSNIARRQCPLCRQPCHIPMAVPGSGYVYCRQCITDYVKQYHRCPTTHRPVSNDQLIKIYED
jgi:peroxin-12